MKRMSVPFSVMLLSVVVIFLAICAFTAGMIIPAEDLKSKYSYKDFESARKCGSCHPGTYQQWTQAMMSQAWGSLLMTLPIMVLNN